MNVRGNAMMDQLTRELSVPFKRNGSMVLAFNEEDVRTLETLLDRGVKKRCTGCPDCLRRSGAVRWNRTFPEMLLRRWLRPAVESSVRMKLTIAAAGNAMDNGVRLHTGFEVTDAEFSDGVWTLTSAAGDRCAGKLYRQCCRALFQRPGSGADGG